MNTPILSVWEHKFTAQSIAKIIPDGCRDILFWAGSKQRPIWTVTSLDNHPYNAQIETGAYLKGYRLQPGALINTQELLRSLDSRECNTLGIGERINSFCTTSPDVEEAMACLGAPTSNSVNHAANTLGVSMRTLQRLINAATGRTPAAWLSLSRARRIARILPTAKNLAETAFDFGYADQAHMSREVKRWFGTSPAKIPFDNAVLEQLGQPGFY